MEMFAAFWFFFFHLWYILIFNLTEAKERSSSLTIRDQLKMPIHASVVQSCFYIFPMRSAINSGNQLEHLCPFCFIPSCYISVLSLYAPVTLSFISPLIHRNQNNTLQRKFTTGKWISSVIDGFHIARQVYKFSRHHNGALVLRAQPVFDKTNNSNEKSEHNRQQFLINAWCWRCLIYSTSMQIWFPLLPWLFRFI